MKDAKYIICNPRDFQRASTIAPNQSTQNNSPTELQPVHEVMTEE